MSDRPPVLAVDGPGGSGKGTVSQRLAAHFGWHLLDSGALYRLCALAARRRGVDLDDEAAVAGVARALEARFVAAAPGGLVRAELSGDDVSDAIRTEACGSDASRVAALPRVREALLARQRAFRIPPGLVADGRDMGTVVFPDAELKVFLDASPEERARRRHKQLIEKGIDVSLPSLVAEIAARDQRDRERPVAPLRAAEDAQIIDTTAVGIEEVVARILAIAEERGLAQQAARSSHA